MMVEMTMLMMMMSQRGHDPNQSKFSSPLSCNRWNRALGPLPMLACVLLTDQDDHDNHYVEAFVDDEGGKVKKI